MAYRVLSGDESMKYLMFVQLRVNCTSYRCSVNGSEIIMLDEKLMLHQ